jgi:hypothetical protein
LKYVAIPAGENRSNRFEQLCELMDADVDAAARMSLWGYLCAWYVRWGQDEQFDHGLLFDITEKRMGAWAEHPRPQAFGNALVRAGYVAPIREFYVGLHDDNGFVVLRGDGGVALDTSWDGWHRKSPIAARLARYLTDARRALTWAAKLEEDGADPPADGNGAGGHSGKFPENIRKVSGSGPAPGPAGSPLDVQTSKDVNNVKEVTNVTTSDVNDVSRGPGVNNPPRVGGQRTGNPKTIAQRNYIRDHKYDDTIGCLQMLDHSDGANKVWIEACERDIGYVHLCLSELTETDDAWSRLANPCGALMKKLLPHVQGLRRRRR